jgi:hypothetical protein
MFQLKISARIYLLVALAVVALAIFTFVSINNARMLRSDTRDAELRSIVESALNITKGQYAGNGWDQPLADPRQERQAVPAGNDRHGQGQRIRL